MDSLPVTVSEIEVDELESKGLVFWMENVEVDRLESKGLVFWMEDVEVDGLGSKGRKELVEVSKRCRFARRFRPSFRQLLQVR